MQDSQRHKSGEIHAIYGPMFSGKTSDLINNANDFIKALGHEKVIIIKHASDNRYTPHDSHKRSQVYLSQVVSHAGDKIDAFATDDLNNVILTVLYSQVSVVAIDEGQFFSGLADFCEIARKYGKKVIVAGLDLDFRKEWFPEMKKLIDIADRKTVVTAICDVCGDDAQYTFRKNSVLPLGVRSQVAVIGGSELYHPLCSGCYKTSSS